MLAEYEELIVIETLETYSGSLPGRHRKKVMAWAGQNQAFILANWNLLNGKK